MKYFGVLFFLVSSFVYAEEDIKSCLTYSFKKIKRDHSELIMRNIFNEHLYKALSNEFPNETVDWSNWLTATENFTDEDGTPKTYIKGCFVINDIYTRPSLVMEIMAVADKRAKAALKFYSDQSSEESIDSMNTEQLFDRMGELLERPDMQEEIEKHRSGTEK